MQPSMILDRPAFRRAAARGLGVHPDAIDVNTLLADPATIARAGHVLHQALARTPDDVDLSCALAHLLLAYGHAANTGLFAGQALRHAPDRAEPYALLAMAAAINGGWQITAGYALIAATLEPRNAHVAGLLAHACHSIDPHCRRSFPWLKGQGAPPRLIETCPGTGTPDLLLLRGLGENVLLSPYRNASGRRGLALDVEALCHLLDTNHAYRVLLEIAGHLKPKLLYVQAGGVSRRDELPAELLLALREALGCRVVMLYTDAVKPFFHNQHRRIYTPAVDAFVAIDAGFPPEACGPAVINGWTPVDAAQFFPDEGERPIDVLFSGSRREHYQYRGRMLDALRAQGIAVEVTGDGERRLSRGEYAATTRRAKIVLNFSRAPTRPVAVLSDRSDDAVHLKGRVIEALASGCLLLEERNTVTGQFLTEGEHYVAFDGIDELLAKIRHYLAHPAEREAIARAGHAAWKARYTEEAFWTLVWDAAQAGRPTAPPPDGAGR